MRHHYLLSVREAMMQDLGFGKSSNVSKSSLLLIQRQIVRLAMNKFDIEVISFHFQHNAMRIMKLMNEILRENENFHFLFKRDPVHSIVCMLSWQEKDLGNYSGHISR